jgi:hypothetical protein
MKKLLLLFAFVTNTCLTASVDLNQPIILPAGKQTVDPKGYPEKILVVPGDFDPLGSLSDDTCIKFYNNASTNDYVWVLPKKVYSFFKEIGTVAYQLGHEVGVNTTKTKYEPIIKQKTELEKEINRLKADGGIQEALQKHQEDVVKTKQEVEKEVVKIKREVKMDLLKAKESNEKLNRDLTEANKQVKDLKNNSSFLSLFNNSSTMKKVVLIIVSLYFLISGVGFNYLTLPSLIAKAVGK